MISRIRESLKNNEVLFEVYIRIRSVYYSYLVSDEQVIKRQFKKRLGREVDLENPVNLMINFNG